MSTPTLIDDALFHFLVIEPERLRDPVRETARSQLRALLKGNVYCGRRPESAADMPCLTISMISGEPAHHFLNETSCAYDAVQFISYSLVQRESAAIAENLRRLLTAFRTTDPVQPALWCGKTIASCRAMSRPTLLTYRAFDGSDDWWFSYQSTWRIIHRQVVPSNDAATVFRSY